MLVICKTKICQQNKCEWSKNKCLTDLLLLSYSQCKGTFQLTVRQKQFDFEFLSLLIIITYRTMFIVLFAKLLSVLQLAIPSLLSTILWRSSLLGLFGSIRHHQVWWNW